MSKAKVVQKNAFMRVLKTKCKENGQDFTGSPKIGFLCHVLNLFHHIAIRSTIKPRSEVSLVSLTLRAHSVLKFLKKCN